MGRGVLDGLHGHGSQYDTNRDHFVGWRGVAAAGGARRQTRSVQKCQLMRVIQYNQ